MAVEHLDADQVAEELARAVLVRCKSHRGFPSRRSSKSRAAEGDLLEDDTRRRQFLAAFLALPDPESVQYLSYPLSLLTLKDLQWFIDRIVGDVAPDPTEVKGTWNAGLMTDMEVQL